MTSTSSQHLNYNFPSRPLVAIASILAIFLLVFADYGASGGIDPFESLPPIAYGSGQASGGAHCTGG